MPIIGLLSTGAGLLAKGVSNLFSGAGKEARQEKRAARRAGRLERRAERRGEVAPVIEEIFAAPMGRPPPQVLGDVAPGDFEAAPPSARPRRGVGDAGDFIQKNWMWLALGALVLFGGKLFKPKRRAPRRRAAKPKTVIRYRTRKPVTRKR